MKSHASDLLEVAACLLKDVAAMCTAESYVVLDLNTIKSRVEKEGISFLTITLPTFASDLETALDQGCIMDNLFRSFKKRRAIPAFLQGMLLQIFDINTGRILNEPSIPAIAGVRQICLAFKKVKIECTAGRTRRALGKFIQDELIFKAELDPCSVDEFVNISNLLWGNIFGSIRYNPLNFIPKHGPGTTAEGYTGNVKYTMTRWHERLEPYFPFFSYARSISALEDEGLKGVSFVSPSEEQPVKVTAVPKTLKTPRIIAIEPTCMQFAQQAVAAQLVDRLQTALPTRGHINFKDQSVNRRLALTSSKDKSFATIDLSAASDRVPLSLSMRMFDCNPDLQGAIYACRSRKAQVSVDGVDNVIDLAKFASMGSALCFPVEAMYFYTICVLALLKSENLPVTWTNICKVGRKVYVYGDDILVPTDKADTVSSTLSKFYLKVNMSKSFWNGKFRESCGMDAYDGQEVTPVYVRQLRPRGKRDSHQLISWVATSNLLYTKGYWLAASHLMSKVEAILGPLPVVSPRSAGLGKLSFQPGVSIGRWGLRYQRPEVLTWVAAPVYRHDKLEGHSALWKCLLRLHQREVGMLEEERPLSDIDPAITWDPVTEDSQHLQRTARFGAVALKRQWIPTH